jgi:hypothetical protein
VNVVRLLRKDLWQQRFLAPGLVAFEIASGEIILRQLPATTPAIVALATITLFGLIAAFVFCLRTMVVEEKHRAFLFLKTLPLDDRELVGAKFAVNALLVAGNFVALALYHELRRRLVGAPAAPVGAGVVLAAGALQMLANALFLAVALLFDSDKAVWVPFPLIWVATLGMANLRRIAGALGLGDGATALRAHALLVAATELVLAALVFQATVALFRRRRQFG